MRTTIITAVSLSLLMIAGPSAEATTDHRVTDLGNVPTGLQPIGEPVGELNGQIPSNSGWELVGVQDEFLDGCIGGWGWYEDVAEGQVLRYFGLSPLSQGDANADQRVDGADLSLWQQNYAPLGVADGKGFFEGDWNTDGKVDGADLSLWQQNYNPLGYGAPYLHDPNTAAHAPEPLTLLGLTMGVAAVIPVLRRRRKAA